ncbi:MAG TPA: winged helix-turn-helix domain-containing protein [Flavisolibacter sp.]|jgi:DNA-binding transcriptional regulator YhcF (GntR family)|nr:winged helix-turn-helix domain-containing protein [Flavisolibacter sp.]
MYKVKVPDHDGYFSKVELIANATKKDIEKGIWKHDDKLPSIIVFSQENNVARNTIEKAYKLLRDTGYIASLPSRGYFVTKDTKSSLKVLLLFNKLSSFKKIIYDEIVGGLGKRVKIDLQLHH